MIGFEEFYRINRVREREGEKRILTVIILVPRQWQLVMTVGVLILLSSLHSAQRLILFWA